MHEGDLERSHDLFLEGLSAARQEAPRRLEVALTYLAECELEMGRCDSAVERLSEALATCQTSKNRPIEAHVRGTLSWIYRRRGDFERAGAELEAACACAAAVAGPLLSGWLLNERAQLLAVIGEPEAAEEAFAQAEHKLHSAKQRLMLVHVCANHGMFALARGEVSVAASALRLGDEAAAYLGLGPRAKYRREIEALRAALEACEGGSQVQQG
jgi:tetratricopeptide (TPR) repeat protein